MSNKFDIFISYRREGGYDTAKHLYDLLIRDGYRVSFDIDTLRNGDFDVQLYERIDQCKDFLLIVDQHAFDRCLDPNSVPQEDWLRCELAYALKKNKNIIPVFLSGVKGFPRDLPEDIAKVAVKNGPEYNRYHFNSFYKDLKKRFLKSLSINKIWKGLGLGLLFIIIVFGVAFFIVHQPYVEPIPSISPITTDTIDEQIAKAPKKRLLTPEEEAFVKFTGHFLHLETQSIMWDLVLDPIGKDASIDLEEIHGDISEYCNVTNIKKSLGYMGTDFHMPEYWEVTSFNIATDLKSAEIGLLLNFSERTDLPCGAHCTLKLELDDYDNLRVSYSGGSASPWIIPEEYGYKEKFMRQ